MMRRHTLSFTLIAILTLCLLLLEGCDLGDFFFPDAPANPLPLPTSTVEVIGEGWENVPPITIPLTPVPVDPFGDEPKPLEQSPIKPLTAAVTLKCDDQPSLNLITVDQSGAQVTTLVKDFTTPLAWSESGLIYSDMSGNLNLMDTQSKQTTILAENPGGFIRSAAVRTDNVYFIETGSGGSSPALYSVPLSGGTSQPVEGAVPDGFSEITFAGENTVLVTHTLEPNQSTLSIIDDILPPSNPVPVVTPQAGSVETPKLMFGASSSPDGTMVAIEGRDESEQAGDLFVMLLNGGFLFHLELTEAACGNPSWINNDALMATCKINDVRYMCVFNLDGTVSDCFEMPDEWGECKLSSALAQPNP